MMDFDPTLVKRLTRSMTMAITPNQSLNQEQQKIKMKNGVNSLQIQNQEEIQNSLINNSQVSSASEFENLELSIEFSLLSLNENYIPNILPSVTSQYRLQEKQLKRSWCNVKPPSRLVETVEERTSHCSRDHNR